jgi:hypothetical protein
MMNTIAGVAMVRPLPRAASGNPSPLSGAWFEAQTAAGAVRLYASGAARHAADAAVALGRCETLLDALDEWIGVPLEWKWIAAPAWVTANASHARIHWRPEESVKNGRKELVCRLEFPWSLLRRLPSPDASLARQLHWPDVPAVLTISQLRIDADELALLEVGGAVILPESMQPNWFGTLRALDESGQTGAGVPVAITSPSELRRVVADQRAPGRSAAGGDRIGCEVRLGIPHAIPGDRLACWYEGALGEITERAGLWRSATEREPARCLGTGELMPWGDGWALVLQELYEIRQIP